jgi:hypothetical protein
VLLGARLMGTAVNVTHTVFCPDIGPECALRPEPGQVHDQQFWIAELRLLAELALRDWLSVELQLPLRLSATTIVFRRLDGTAFTPESADIHHRNETLVGLGDPWLQLRARRSLGAFEGSLSGGFTVPVGRTEPNPFALGRAGLVHQHIQFGSGVVNPLLGGDLSYSWARVSARLSALAQLSFGQNLYGFQAGSRVLGGAGVNIRVVEGLLLGATVDSVTELPERWDGRIEQDGNVGRSDVLVGGQLDWTVGDVRLSLSVRVPVFQYFFADAADSQLRYPVMVGLGVSRAFNLRPSGP